MPPVPSYFHHNRFYFCFDYKTTDAKRSMPVHQFDWQNCNHIIKKRQLLANKVKKTERAYRFFAKCRVWNVTNPVVTRLSNSMLLFSNESQRKFCLNSFKLNSKEIIKENGKMFFFFHVQYRIFAYSMLSVINTFKWGFLFSVLIQSILLVI